MTKNKFLSDLKEKNLEIPVLYMMLNGDSYFDSYEVDFEEYGFKDADEAWDYINNNVFGKIKEVSHTWESTDLAKFVWHAEKYNEFYSAFVTYSSYEGYYFEDVDLKRVFPKEKTITVYE